MASKTDKNCEADSRNDSLTVKEERELEHLSSLWNQYFTLVENIEARYPTILIALIAPLMALCTYRYTRRSSISQQDFDTMCIVVMFITLLVLAFLAFEFRYAAMLRGELIRLEKQINKLLDSDVYIWNSVQLNGSKTRGNTNCMLTATVAITIVAVGITLLISITLDWLNYIFIAIAVIDLIFIIIVFGRNKYAQSAAEKADATNNSQKSA